MAGLGDGKGDFHRGTDAVISLAEFRIAHPPIPKSVEFDGHRSTSFARSSANSIIRRGVLRVFFTKAATMTTRQPEAVTYRARPSTPRESGRISHSFPLIWRT